MKLRTLTEKTAQEEPETVPGKIVGGRIKFISLCPMGKNRIQASYKAAGIEEDQQLELTMAVKAQEDFAEEGLLTGIVYAPGVVDDDGNWAEADAIKALAYDHMIHREGIDVWHDGEALNSDQAALVESFIIQKSDPRFDGLPFDPEGGWGVVMQLGEDQRSRYRGEDGWRGLSMGGTIIVEPDAMPATKAVSKDDFFRAMRRLVRRALSNEPEVSSIRGMDLSIVLPRPGERDFEGNLRAPAFHINLFGDL